ncbi:phage minor capsid protein [Pueribacillus sp. YX66]|uniref:phage minor capsid protein n=1 Tax=Pueribacillus sp. YX66 TaxID=3229242 RepID=UPI00358CFBB1
MNPKRPKITPNQLNMYTQPVTHVYQALEQEIFEMIARRLKTSKHYDSDNVLEWQIDKMNQLRLVNDETVRALSKTTGIAEKEIRKAIHNAGIETIKSIDYELKGIRDTLPLPTQIDAVMESYIRQTFRELDNFVNQTLITTNYGEGTVTRMYRRIVEETTGKVLSGLKTTNKAIAETVIEWSRKGIETAFVDRGGNVWHLERYAETVIRSTVNRTYNDLRMSRMEDYDIDLVLVSALPDPRDICSHIQGKVASIKPISENDSKYPSIYEFGYGEPSGLRGINCRHMFFPFVDGVMENNQPQYSESEMTHNRELREKQRYYERQIRQAKRELKLAEIIGDEGNIQKQKKLLRNRQARMREFINETGRTREYSRERVIV